jgi:hypothetical protein
MALGAAPLTSDAIGASTSSSDLIAIAGPVRRKVADPVAPYRQPSLFDEVEP